MASQFISKQKNNSTIIKFFKDNKNKKEKKIKKERDKIRVKKWLNKCKPIWIDTRRYYPKIIVSYNNKIKQTYKRKEHKSS